MSAERAVGADAFLETGRRVLATQPFSILLGGNAITDAGGTALRVPVVTAEYEIDCVRPVIGERLVARARAVHVGKTRAVCQCDVFAVADGVEKICAYAQGTITRLGDAPVAGDGDGAGAGAGAEVAAAGRP